MKCDIDIKMSRVELCLPLFFILIVLSESSEFKRITTVHLQSKLFSKLDPNSGNLLKAYAKKVGVQGKEIRSIIVPTTQV